MKTRACSALLQPGIYRTQNAPTRAAIAGFLLLLLVLLLPPRAAALVFPPQGDDTTPSMGVFRIIVDPLFRPLLSPTGAPTFFAGYTGFHSSDGRLTSPMLIDTSTTIGRSNPNPRLTPFPQPLGAGSWDSIGGYSDYPAIPFTWFTAPLGTDEVLTEIKSFILSTVNASTGQICSNSTVPMAPPNYPMIKAGTFAGVSPRSLGIVQEDGPPGPPDFPARSFFDIFVEVNLPSLPGTESSVAFPATGAILTNVQPMIITNLSLGSFPPQVVYIHGGNTNAVELRFKFSNPPYWAAGDLFGTLTLAGHGTYTNDCTQEAALTAAVLGTPTAPMPELPIEWLRTNTPAPSAGSTYTSTMTDSNPPTSSDTLVFSFGPSALMGRNFVVSNFLNPILPPTGSTPATYNDTAFMTFFELSIDGQSWSSAQGNGSLVVKMSNTTPTGATTSTYGTQILQMNLNVASTFGSLLLRASTSKPSLGQHTIRSDPRGYRISSFFDVFTELSTDGGASWIPADRSVRMQAGAPAAAPGSLFISRNGTGGALVLQWLGPFTLQQSGNVRSGYTDISGSTGGSLLNSWPLTAGASQQYFRLRQ